MLHVNFILNNVYYSGFVTWSTDLNSALTLHNPVLLKEPENFMD